MLFFMGEFMYKLGDSEKMFRYLSAAESFQGYDGKTGQFTTLTLNYLQSYYQ